MSIHQGSFDPLADLRLLTMKQVREITGYSANHIYRMMRMGEFPQSIKIGPNSVRWRKKDIEDWLERRAMGACLPPKPCPPTNASVRTPA